MVSRTTANVRRRRWSRTRRSEDLLCVSLRSHSVFFVRCQTEHFASCILYCSFVAPRRAAHPMRRGFPGRSGFLSILVAPSEGTGEGIEPLFRHGARIGDVLPPRRATLPTPPTPTPPSCARDLPRSSRARSSSPRARSSPRTAPRRATRVRATPRAARLIILGRRRRRRRRIRRRNVGSR